MLLSNGEEKVSRATIVLLKAKSLKTMMLKLMMKMKMKRVMTRMMMALLKDWLNRPDHKKTTK